MITLTKPKIRPDWMTTEQYAAAPESLVIRELEVGGKLLITSLTCPVSIPKQALKTLYVSRWQVELDIRNIKTTLGMDTLSCKTPLMAVKEMWVYLLAYNLIRLLMAQSALLADILPRTISFKHTLQLWLGWQRTDEPKAISGLLFLIAEQTVGNRPGRIEPRAVKRRPKPYPLLTKTRAEAREEIKNHGHPKKLK